MHLPLIKQEPLASNNPPNFAGNHEHPAGVALGLMSRFSSAGTPGCPTTESNMVYYSLENKKQDFIFISNSKRISDT